jgi:hypothetical protein
MPALHAPIAIASAAWVSPIGWMNSSTRISPTVAGLRFVINMVRLTCSYFPAQNCDFWQLAVTPRQSESPPEDVRRDAAMMVLRWLAEAN